MSERQYLPMIEHSIEAAENLANKSNDREKMLLQAARLGLEGHWDRACDTWDRVLTEYPRDVMALQLAHLTDFLRGDAVNLRDRVGRVLTHWDHDFPGYSYVLGMHAFGLEECNQYQRAEDTANYALSIEPRDGWSVHALGHVMEMQGRYDDGITMYTERINGWAPDNGFAFHNWWHLALYNIEKEDFQAALGLYDSQILPEQSDASMQLLDASALLWRLQLYGTDVEHRWQALADMWASKTTTENGYYPFNDMHSLIALASCGRLGDAKQVLNAVEKSATEPVSALNRMAREIGLPVCRGLLAFAEEQYDEAIEHLLPIRSIAHRFGGSHAQRDLLSQTVLEAAIRSGQRALAANLLSERMSNKPATPLSHYYQSKITH